MTGLLLCGQKPSVWTPTGFRVATIIAIALLVPSVGRAQPDVSRRVADGSGAVFLPDPLSSARATYGEPGFLDAADADSPQLSAQRVSVPLRDLSFEGAVYSLVGPWAEAVEFQPPDRGPYDHDSPSFEFERSDAMFEAVNAYYHIDRFMRYLNDTLGVAVRPYQYDGGVRFDPHGTPASTAYYLPSEGVLVFGEGNVDKAEDADVILHELGHGIQDWVTRGDIAFGGVLGGTADYWANSYNRSFGRWGLEDDEYHWVFHWASHNEFGPGRVTDYAGSYPSDLTGDDHVDGQILSSALMEVWDAIGREPTDRLVLAALGASRGGDDQEDFARAFLQADRDVYGGEHVAVIGPILEARGYTLAPTDQKPPPMLDDRLVLGAPYPNPTSGPFTIRLSCGASSGVRVVLRDTLGRLVRELYDGPVAGGGAQTLSFDEGALPPGMYWVTATGAHSSTRRPVSIIR